MTPTELADLELAQLKQSDPHQQDAADKAALQELNRQDYFRKPE